MECSEYIPSLSKTIGRVELNVARFTEHKSAEVDVYYHLCRYASHFLCDLTSHNATLARLVLSVRAVYCFLLSIATLHSCAVHRELFKYSGKG